MHKLTLDALATPDNFDEAGYLSANPDVAGAIAQGLFPSGASHFGHFGQAEGRRLRLAAPVDPMRAVKLSQIEHILRDDLPHVRRGLKYDYLSDQLRAATRIADTAAVSANNYDGFAEALIEQYNGGIVADCGAGRRPVYYSNVVNVEIVDYDTTDIIAVGEELPFKTGTIDAVISIAVLEHVRDPFRCAAEIARVLRPGGRLLCAVPFLQPEHGYPHHYYNMAPQGLRALFEDHLHIDDHVVAAHMLPVWSLTWFLRAWSDGLTGPARDAFQALRVGDLATASPADLLTQPWVTDLPTQKNFELASATMLLAHKR